MDMAPLVSAAIGQWAGFRPLISRLPAPNGKEVGGAGDDLLFGGAGRDTFVFAAGWGHDTVADWKDGELFDLRDSGATQFADLTVEIHGADVVVTFGEGSIRVLKAAGHIDAGDFLF
jgi:Ca2+-binding RTX toxin-like protein